MHYRIRSDCRLCGSEPLKKVLDFPNTPLANEFPRTPGEIQEVFPLWLSSCEECGHVQLPVVVDPERLFREYVYVSGTSPVFVDHFRRYADECEEELQANDFVVEIGSNDGTLLRFFKEKGMRVLGIDPATAIAEKATESGIPTLPKFFTEELANQIKFENGKASLVVANNVFAHADDLNAIARGVKSLLDQDGRFVFEVSYLADVVENVLFDTVYHEHLSYHAVEPLRRFLRKNGLWLLDAKRVATHGGSIRVTAVHAHSAREYGLSMSASAMNLLTEEKRAWLWTRGTFAILERKIAERRDELLRILHGARMAGKRIAAYGAPAKATTLVRTFGIEEMLDFVVDDSPLKQGRWLPGGNVPVLPSSAIEERKPDYLIILAWNFADSILEKLSGYRNAGGKCIVPLPRVRVVD